jgi:hypothetical protein
MPVTQGKPLKLFCGQCLTELDESNAYEFGGTLVFACEVCIRKHYKGYPVPEIKLQLKERLYCTTQALRVTSNRRLLEQAAAKMST